MTSIFDTHKMHKGDVIFASLDNNGRTLVHIKQDNFASMAEVMKQVISVAGQFYGLGRIQVRNMTQGWSTSMAVASPHRISLNPSRPTPPATAPAMRSGMQYTIQFSW